MQIKSAKELEVYKKSYDLAMRIFEISKGILPSDLCPLSSVL